MKNLLYLFIFILSVPPIYAAEKSAFWWPVQSVDTMKYSRDLSREKINDQAFDKVIDNQVRNIADINSTHVAIDTPYDEEFVPILKRWVEAARKYNLHVWFRGNFSGWERWFGYGAITSETHHQLTEKFILNHADLFMDGDIFTTCPECENGGPGDPRQTGKVTDFRNFLIDEYTICTKAFTQIHKNVTCNYFSMNADVAGIVLDKQTTSKIGGVISIDHYVLTPEKLVSDIRQIANSSGGKIILGEFGIPIPDIHGNMNEDQQAHWLSIALPKLTAIPELTGINYWLGVGGSTAIWKDDGSAKKAVAVLKKYFKPRTVSGLIINEYKQPLSGVTIANSRKFTVSAPDGSFTIPYIQEDLTINFIKESYETRTMTINEVSAYGPIILKHSNVSIFERIRIIIRALFHS